MNKILRSLNTKSSFWFDVTFCFLGLVFVYFIFRNLQHSLCFSGYSGKSNQQIAKFGNEFSAQPSSLFFILYQFQSTPEKKVIKLFFKIMRLIL